MAWAFLPPLSGFALGYVGIRFPLLALCAVIAYGLYLFLRTYRFVRQRRLQQDRVQANVPLMLGVFLLIWATLLAIAAGVMTSRVGFGWFVLRPFLGSLCAWGLAYFSFLDRERVLEAARPHLEA